MRGAGITGTIATAFAIAVLSPAAASGKGAGPPAVDCDPFALAGLAPAAARVSAAGIAAGVVEPNVEEAYERALDQRQLRRAAERVAGPIPVPVHVHVIQSAPGPSIVPQSQIDAQMNVLNQTFGGAVGGDNSGFVFELVDVDVTANATWVALSEDPFVERQFKTALHEGGSRTLNVYLVDLPTLLGYATFPDEYAGDPAMDGVVVHKDSVPGGSSTNYNLGYTATHEVGHWLGLFHTFQGIPDGCTPPGDMVEDTPYEADPTSGCPASKDTCPAVGVDPIQNYMDYSFDACMNQFTAGQTERMHALTGLYRNSAPTAAGQTIMTSGNAVAVTPATDPDRDGLTYAATAQPKHGTVTSSGSSLTYTPKAGYAGNDSFTVQATDTFGAAATAPVNVDVNGGLKLKAKNRQKLSKLAVSGGCGSVGCKLTASGKIVATGSNNRVALASRSFKLKKATGTAKANGKAKLKLKLSKSKQRQLLGLLKDGWKAKASITVKSPGSTKKVKVTVTR